MINEKEIKLLLRVYEACRKQADQELRMFELFNLNFKKNGEGRQPHKYAQDFSKEIANIRTRLKSVINGTEDFLKYLQRLSEGEEL